MKAILFSLLIFTASLSFAQQHCSENMKDNDGRKQGLWVDTLGNYTLKGHYVNDLKDGVWISYESGTEKILKIEEFKAGKKDGVFLEFNKRNNTLASEQYYSNDLPDGKFKLYSVSGMLESISSYKNGELDGLQQKFYENSNKPSEEANYLKGVKEGLSKWYNQDGKLIAEYNYLNGELNGEQKTYFPDGTLRSVDTYVKNVYEGMSTEYYENGKVKLQGLYKAGEKDGKWIKCNDSGAVISTIQYKNGVEK